MRNSRVRRPVAAERHCWRRWAYPHLVDRSRHGRRALARHTLLQQQLGGLDARVGMKPLNHAVTEHGIGQRDQCHALVVSEERADDAAVGVRIGNDPLAPRIVDGVEETVVAEHAHIRESAEILGAACRIDRGGKSRRIRRDDKLVAKSPLEPQARDAEGFVLIVAVPVDR